MMGGIKVTISSMDLAVILGTPVAIICIAVIAGFILFPLLKKGGQKPKTNTGCTQLKK